ncbi:hypothetical protein A2714_01885 [Candidatus Woesebacteria bacterium RIFCSPHIGHO2_01_FULL_38_9]|uniref:Type II secretion system protein GspG C-terminal domain-containing protein n=2 Tax=Candidatus Woeseibacteriota TaxID=1752722 RepID=A0A1F7Y198_9BACT|nr:MAG: hypothetical protein A2714_01885 [Candidatus Woesebacteria bacterium RIFCSPHIGHO2_01_FULL_38_9]OGM60150.1 MAG: hypothetical protein A3A75_05610 [Candidatus Woesebacteria bacterium RIFCSPLOWO2_01_FULL_39_10]
MTALKRGFTLIELLIVIAILGVLAVVVLVAINPVQQLARTRDSGRISTVSQLGHAMEAYGASHDSDYPVDLATLQSTGEIQNIPALVANSVTSVCAGGDEQTSGWCYDDEDGPPDAFAIWSALEATTNLTVNAACGGTAAYATYLSVSGRTCIICDTEPSAASVVADCDN